MATDFLSTPSTATAVGLFVAGLGAVYAYTQLGVSKDTRALAHATGPSGDGDSHVRNVTESTPGTARKGRKKKKGKGVSAGVGEDEGESKGKAEGGTAVADPFPQTIPGDLEDVDVGVDVGVGVGVRVDAGTNVGSQEAFPAGAMPKRGNGGKTRTKRKKQKKQGKGKDSGSNSEVGSETDKEVDAGVGRAATLRPRSGDSTDASVSLSPSVSASALASSRAMGRGRGRASPAVPSQLHAQVRAHAPSQSREVDTDSSWTHVDHHRLKASRSTNRRTRGLSDAMDVTSSDLASTASDSPVTERMDGITTDMQEARVDPMRRTLAEKLVQGPRKTPVDDMLEQSDFPTVARVMRVQPPADETPVPGFSWEDYGDVVEESVLIDDADQEDEGEWGVVKSRNRSRPLQTMATTMTTTPSLSHTPTTSQTMTKKQRQNARKRELAKSAKAETELARLEGLAKHKRELERLRIIEQSQQGVGKRPSGGMQAKVDGRGQLVWE